MTQQNIIFEHREALHMQLEWRKHLLDVSEYVTHAPTFIHSHTHTWSNTKLSLSWPDNNKKKNIKKRWKSHLTQVLKFLLLKAFWSFYCAFLYIYFIKYQITLS
jgi:hypothetical protein